MADAPSKPEPSTTKAAGPKYETWELPAGEGQLDQEVQIVRECIARGLDWIGAPEVYDGTKMLRRWRVQVR